jgi:hypothetical protein
MSRLILVIAGVLILAPGIFGAEQGSLQDAKAARKLYVAKCARCHPLYNGSDYSQENWEGWLQKMVAKAKLTPKQQELLLENRLNLGAAAKSPRH